jgi:hypothetical protein
MFVHGRGVISKRRMQDITPHGVIPAAEYRNYGAGFKYFRERLFLRDRRSRQAGISRRCFSGPASQPKLSCGVRGHDPAWYWRGMPRHPKSADKSAHSKLAGYSLSWDGVGHGYGVANYEMAIKLPWRAGPKHGKITRSKIYE